MKKLLILLLLLATFANAASFDCNKTATKIEKMVCSDEKLSRLDDNLSVVFKETMQRSSDKERLRQDQRRWLKDTRNRCETKQCLESQYQIRLLYLTNRNPNAEMPSSLIFDAIKSYDCNNNISEGDKDFCNALQTNNGEVKLATPIVVADNIDDPQLQKYIGHLTPLQKRMAVYFVSTPEHKYEDEFSIGAYSTQEKVDTAMKNGKGWKAIGKLKLYPIDLLYTPNKPKVKAYVLLADGLMSQKEILAKNKGIYNPDTRISVILPTYQGMVLRQRSNGGDGIYNGVFYTGVITGVLSFRDDNFFFGLDLSLGSRLDFQTLRPNLIHEGTGGERYFYNIFSAIESKK